MFVSTWGTQISANLTSVIKLRPVSIMSTYATASAFLVSVS